MLLTLCFSRLSQYKAFNLVAHKLFLQKLKYYKINKLSLSWFELYISHRTQQVNINTSQSKSGNVLCFYFRSSVIFIIKNDLPLFIGDLIRSVDLYADDMTMYDIGLNKIC